MRALQQNPRTRGPSSSVISRPGLRPSHHRHRNGPPSRHALTGRTAVTRRIRNGAEYRRTKARTNGLMKVSRDEDNPPPLSSAASCTDTPRQRRRRHRNRGRRSQHEQSFGRIYIHDEAGTTSLHGMASAKTPPFPPLPAKLTSHHQSSRPPSS